MSEIFLKLVNMGISASWIVIAVLMLRLLLRKAPKWINAALWGIVGIRLICPFSFESMFSLLPSNETIPAGIVQQSRPSINSGINFVDSTVNGYISDRYSEGVTVPMDYSKNIITALAVVWLIGISAMLIYMLISYIRVKNNVKEAVFERENVWLCDRISTPFIFGIIKPKIYIPFNLSEQDFELVTAHEKSHIKRKDYLWKPLGFLILTLHWFNPLVWLGYILLCRDIELACDEKVIKEFNNEQRADYSQALLTCSVNRRMISACPLAFGEVGVKERVKSVLNYKKPAFWITAVSVLAVIITAVCLLTNPNGKSLQNIEQRNLTNCIENTVSLLKYNGENYEAVPKFSKDLLHDLFAIRISKKEVSQSRSEDRDRVNSLVLQTVYNLEEDNINGIYLCFNHDFTEVWANDSVKPTLSYKVLNPEKAEKIYNDLCNGVGAENNENIVEPLKSLTIQFYNEPTAENETAIVDKQAIMSKDDFNLFWERIQSQKWVDDALVDRLTYYFDCRISYDDFVYIGYDQKVVYYKGQFTELTDDNAVLIKSYNKAEILKITDRAVTEQIPCSEAIEGFYRDDEYIYEFPCIKSQYVEVHYSDATKENVKEALENGRVKIEDLDAFGIGYSKREIDGN